LILRLPLFLLLTLTLSAAQQTITAPHVKLSLVSELDSLRPGQTAWVGLRFELEKGWHVYWKNPGDSGEPPKVDWQLPSGFKAGELLFPAPHRLPLQTLMNFGYENEVLYPVELTVPASASGKARLTANVRWMVCEQTCIPGKGTVTLELPVAPSPGKPTAHKSLFVNTRSRLPNLPRVFQFTVTADRDFFTLTARTPRKTTAAEFFPADDLVIENAPPQPFTSTASGFRLRLRKSELMSKPPTRLRGLLVLDGGHAYDIDVPITSSPRPTK